MIVKKYDGIKLDPKGRLFLSKGDQAALGEKKVIVVKKGNELLFFSEEEWNRIVQEKLTGLQGAELRRQQRYLGGSAFPEEIEQEGGVVIPYSLRQK